MGRNLMEKEFSKQNLVMAGQCLSYLCGMNLEERINALDWLGSNLENHPGIEDVIINAGHKNPFFTPEFCRLAISGVSSWMKKEVLVSWLKACENRHPRNIGLIMAGNLPLVGWHDIMTIFATGHRCLYKPSSQDTELPEFLMNLLGSEFPETKDYFQKVERMKGIDALIATGSNATATHFDYYFKDIPRIIRGAKSSLGFIYGFESHEELIPLCDDIMQYFGMGCRSITKILIPEDYDFGPFFSALEKYRHLTNHHRFQNNAIYHKAIFLMNGDPFLENDILVVRENKRLFSPPGVLNFEVYKNLEDAKSIVDSHLNEIQCMVSHLGRFQGSLPFGMAQKPEISDYADGVNTLDFLKLLGN